MHLIKEIIREEDFQQITVFNPDGQPKSISKCGYQNNLKQEFSYDEQGRIITIHEEEYCEDQRTERRIKKYEYNGKDYRVLTYLTHQRTIADDTSDKYLLQGIEEWHPVDKLISVQEIKCDGTQQLYERFHNLVTNETYENKLHTPNLQTERVIKPQPVTSELHGEFTIKTLIENDSKIINTYRKGLLEKAETIKIHDGDEYLAFQTIISYNQDGTEKITEKHGRFNSEMMLYKVIEQKTVGNVVETATNEKSYFEGCAGYYDLKTMREALGEDASDIKEHSFNGDFDFHLKTVEHFDAQKNVIYSVSSNPVTGEFYDAYASHHEYNENSLIEFEVEFKQKTKGGPMKNISVKKYYYSD